MGKEAEEIIKKAINSPEFIERMAKGFDLLPCIKTILEFDDVIPLKSLRNILDERIADLNIRDWFERMEKLL